VHTTEDVERKKNGGVYDHAVRVVREAEERGGVCAVGVNELSSLFSRFSLAEE